MGQVGGETAGTAWQQPVPAGGQAPARSRQRGAEGRGYCGYCGSRASTHQGRPGSPAAGERGGVRP